MEKVELGADGWNKAMQYTKEVFNQAKEDAESRIADLIDVCRDSKKLQKFFCATAEKTRESIFDLATLKNELFLEFLKDTRDVDQAISLTECSLDFVYHEAAERKTELGLE